MATPLPPDFKEFLRLLDSASVEYLVVGGYAVSYHGHPRPTGDLDIWIGVDIENAKRVRDVLERFGFPQSGTSPQDFTVPNLIFRMGVPPVRIEVLTGVTGVEFKACFLRRVIATLDGVPANIISRDDLLKNKRAAGRHKDLSDVEELDQ